jgi:hypothetical protein
LRWPWRVLGIGLGLLAAAPAVQAQYLARQVNLSYLAQRAGVIVEGRVIAARYEGHPDYPHVPTVLITLQVEQMLRGPEGERYTFRQFLLPREVRGGKRGYAVGQQLLLFLPEPSRYGLSSPIGHEQGRFHILRDQRGRDMVENEFHNLGLFHNVAQDAEQGGAALSDQQLSVTASTGGPVPLEDFTRLVRHLMLLPRIE